MLDNDYFQLIEQSFIFASCYLQDQENKEENLNKLAQVESSLISILEEYNTLKDREQILKAVN